MSRKSLLWTFKVGFTAVLLFWVFRKLDFRDIGALLRNVDVPTLTVALTLALGPVALLAACRLRILMRQHGMTVSVKKIMEISYIASFYNLFLPGFLASGAIRAYRLSRIDRNLGATITSIVFSRLLENLIFILAGALLFLVDSPPAEFAGLGGPVTTFAIISVFVYVLSFHKGVLRFAYRSVAWFRIIPEAIASKIRRLLDTIKTHHEMSVREHALLVGTCLLQHAFGIASFVLFARAVGLDTGLATLGWLRSFMVVILILPISISGLGAREAVFIFILGAYQVEPASAVAFSALIFSRGLASGIVGALLESRILLSGRRIKPA